MSSAELNILERDVEAARTRLAVDLAQLSSPATLAHFKEDVRHEVTSAAQDGAQDIIGEIKARAAANPAAVLAVGAGLAWHVIHRPPITSLLVGLGLYSLLKTNPQHPHAGAELVSRAGDMASAMTARTGELAGSLKQQADEVASSLQQKAADLVASPLVARAGEIAGSLKEQAGEVAESLKEKAGMLHAGDRATQVMSGASDAAGALVNGGSRAIYGITHNADERDKLLLGAAALALAAAVGISYQRRSG
jgi:hypothetical protein